MKNIYIKPELTVISIDGEKTMNLASEVDDFYSDEGPAKGGNGNITWGDVWADEDIIDEDLY